MAKYHITTIVDGEFKDFISETSVFNENALNAWKQQASEMFGASKVSILGFKLLEPERKSTGIVRRIDELGRIVIPKEIRRALKLSPDGGDPMEMYLTDDGGVLLKAYNPESWGPDNEA